MAAPRPPTVRYPVMLQDWRWLTFLHWRYPPEAVQALLPAGVTVETFDGDAWVSLVPFLMDGVRAPRVPAVPPLSRFPETNVRTYVRGPDGRTGIWFFSLDASRSPAVLTGRASYGLPYFWSRMSVRRRGTVVTYQSRRRFPGPVGVGCEVEVEMGAAWPDPPSPLDEFLTARYTLYSRYAGRIVTADAYHPPWTLRKVAVRRLRQDLVQAAGLPAPEGEPMAHASNGVPVRISRWRRAE